MEAIISSHGLHSDSDNVSEMTRGILEVSVISVVLLGPSIVIQGGQARLSTGTLYTYHLSAL